MKGMFNCNKKRKMQMSSENLMNAFEKKSLKGTWGLAIEKVMKLQESQKSYKAVSTFSKGKTEGPSPTILEYQDCQLSLDRIDEIYENQNQKMDQGMPQLSEDVAMWVKTNSLPVDSEKSMFLAIMDARRHEERLQNQLSEDDFLSRGEALKDLEAIRKRYNIEIDSKHFNNDQQLFNSFLSMNPRAFFDFKHNASISRTLVKNHLKPKYQTGIEKRMLDVIALHEMNEANVKTLKRLEHELTQLREVNKDRFHDESMRLEPVLEAQKAGLPPDKIKRLIEELPSSFLPDEEDYSLQQFIAETNAAHKTFMLQHISEQAGPVLHHAESMRSVESLTEIGGHEGQQLVKTSEFNSTGQKDKQKKASAMASAGPSSRRNSRNIKDYKLTAMQIKRRVPQLYLSPTARDSREQNLNGFNRVLRESLLRPQKQRYVATKQEQASMELQTRSRSLSKQPKLQSPQPASHAQDTDEFPIISVSTAGSAVDFQDSGSKHELRGAGIAKSARRLRIGQRFTRDEDNLPTIASPKGNINCSSLLSPRDQSPLCGLSSMNSILRVDSQEAALNQHIDLRGVSHLIRGHVRSTSKDLRNAGKDMKNRIFMTNQPSSKMISTGQQSSGEHSVTNRSPGLKSKAKAERQFNSVNEKKVNPHLESVKEIIQKARKVRGSDPTSSKIMAVSSEVSRQLLAQSIRNKFIADTTEQVRHFSQYQPAVLKWLFDELQQSNEDEYETQRTAIYDFEQRKLDYKYFNMIEASERSNFDKQFNGKKATE